jgi:propionate catabolism operon transcriptional regulator
MKRMVAENMLKILAISPYENLQVRFEELREKYPEIYLETFVGDLEQGVQIALAKEKSFDLIISRGGTAQEIRKASRLPVVEVEISILDILRIIKMVDHYDQKYTFIGFSNITKQVQILSEILDKNVDVITIQNQSELPDLIEALKRSGYSLIIGDRITYKTAQDMGLNSILIESGEESVENAIKNALNIGSNLQNLRLQSELLQKLQKNLTFSVAVFNQQKQLVYSEVAGENKGIVSLVKNYLKKQEVKSGQRVSFYEQYYGKIYLIEGANDGQNYYFILSKTLPAPTAQTFLEPMIFQQELNKNSALLIGDTITILETELKRQSKMMIIGEPGTGKSSLKQIIHSFEKDRKFWQLHLDAKATDNLWFNLFDTANSPLYDYDATFFVDGITEKTLERLQDLLYFIKQQDNSENQWLFFAPKQPEVIEEISSLDDLYQIELQSIRERKSELNAIISLYIYEINNELNTATLGFDAAAMDEMLSYDWPGNFRQLKKAIRAMISQTRSVFISLETVKKQLSVERSMEQNKPNRSADFLKGKTMAEIQKLVIEQSLEENNGNRTKTAEQLQISRSKVWRLLKEGE